MTTLLRASDSAEFLGIVPALAGFTPTQSLVLVPFHGSRAYGAMRVDLPRDDADPEPYAIAAIDLLTKIEGADAVAVVVYADDDPYSTPDGLVLPMSLQIEALLTAADDVGFRIVDSLCVTPRGWSSYLEDDPEIGQLAATTSVADDQHAGTELPAANLVEKERVGRALEDIGVLLDREEHSHLNGSENPQAIAAIAVVEGIPEFFEMLLESPDEQPPFATAALLWCLDRPLLRDVALVQWATSLDDGLRTLDAQCSFAETGSAIPDDLGRIFLGHGASPDEGRLRLALSVVRLTAARAPRHVRPAPLTLAAWLSWALGRATHAEHYLRLVHAIDPEYGLAALLNTVVCAGMLPEWAFRRGAERAAELT